MAEKKKPARPRPEKVIRQGGVAAEIYAKKSPDGFRYFDFTLVRMFKSGQDRELRSASFFEESAQDLAAAARDASSWIRDQRVPAGEGGPPTQLAGVDAGEAR